MPDLPAIVVHGTVTDERARKYPEFMYRAPVLSQIIPPGFEEWQLCFAFPPPTFCKTEDKADFKVTISQPDNQGQRTVEAWLMPNAASIATEPRLGHRFTASWQLDQDQMIRHALGVTFD